MKPQIKEILEWIYCALIAITIGLLFRYYIGTPTKIQQESMYPTLIENQRLWLNRWGRTTKKLPERGDIITFEAPSKKLYYETELENQKPIAQYNKNPKGIMKKFIYYVLEKGGKQSYIKRVIGLPGDHVKIKEGKVYINDKELKEDYLQPGILTTAKVKGLDDFIVPEKCIFALGDNRNHSTDCREFGCIPLEKIEGKVAIRIWPFNLWGKVK